MSDETNGWQVMSRQPPVNHEGADTAFADVRMQAYRDQMAAFIDAIEGRPSNVGSAADGRAAVAACTGMLDAAAQRRWIDLAP
jgi:predicted dehydrogenase